MQIATKDLSLVPLWRWALVLALLFTMGAFIFAGLLRVCRAHRPSKRTILLTALSFTAGIVVTIFGPWLVRSALSRVILPEHRWEVTRATSPDGAVDAVMVGSGCGPMCADTYLVTVVPKGDQTPADVQRYVFSADDMVDAQIHWKEAHLLEITYKKAFINDFRNVSYPFAKFGDQASWEYKVELRLAPSSQGFSYLQDGTNRQN